MAEFERSRISERVKLGLARAKAQGELGRNRPNVSEHQIEALNHLSVRAAGFRLGVSKSFVHKFRLERATASAQLANQGMTP